MPVRKVNSPPPPLGSNMSDLGYPFRGDYTMPRGINHGHNPRPKLQPSSLNLFVTGSDLVITQPQVPSCHQIECELAVTKGVQQESRMPFALDAGSSLAIPSDSRDYCIGTTVHGPQGTKHYCKLHLMNSTTGRGGRDGGDGGDIFVSTDNLKGVNAVIADGRTYTVHGRCAAIPRGTSGISFQVGGSSSRPSSPTTQQQQRNHLYVNVARNEHGRALEYKVGDNGERVAVQPGSTFAVTNATQNDTLTLFVPQSGDASPQRQTTGSSIFDSGPPEIDVTMQQSSADTVAVNVQLANYRRYRISLEAIGGGGSSQNTASGYGACSINVNSHAQSTVAATVYSDTGALVMKQRINVPRMAAATAPEPVEVRVESTQNGYNIVAPGTIGSSSTITVDGQSSFSGLPGISVPTNDGRTHTVQVSQQSSSSSSSSEHQQSSTRTLLHLLPGTGGSSGNNEWIDQLGALLDKPQTDVVQQMPAVRPGTDAGMKICSYISKLLSRGAPRLRFALDGTTVSGVTCDNHSVSVVTPASRTPCLIPPGSSVQLASSVEPTQQQQQQGEVTFVVQDSASGATAMTCEFATKTDGNRPPSSSLSRFVPLALQAVSAGTNAPQALQQLSVEGIPLHHFSNDEMNLLTYLASQQQQQQHGDAEEGQQQLSNFIAKLLQTLKSYETNIPTLRQELQNFAPFPATPSPHPQDLVRTIVRLLLTEQPQAASPLTGHTVLPQVVSIFRDNPNAPNMWQDRWALVQPEIADEKHILYILQQLLQRLAQEQHAKQSRSTSPSSIPTISFTVGNGCLREIRTDMNMQLHASVDDMDKISIPQGSQLPPSTPFAEGSRHSVSLMSTDAMGNAVCRVVADITASGQVGGSAARCLDLDLGVVSNETVARFTCPPQYRVACFADGLSERANKPGKEAVLRLDSQSGHRVNALIVDQFGSEVFRQRIMIPRLCAPQMSLQMDSQGCHVIPTPGIITTFSLDTESERTLDSHAGTIALSPNTDHKLLLKQYYGDVGAAKIAQLLLVLPQFIDPRDVEDLTHIILTFDRQPNKKVQQLLQLHGRAKSKLMQNLIQAIASSAHDHFTSELWENYYDSVMGLLNGMKEAGGIYSGPSVFFRLKGDESL